MSPKKKVAENLIIVESPAKAGTISDIMGDKYIVRASYGHVRDLPKTKLGVDIKNNYRPDYITTRNKQTIRAINEIQALYDNTSTKLYLATDEDREGESIGWHLTQILEPSKDSNVFRVVFHEITKEAIKTAFEQPRTLNLDLVNAQQARRVLDRLVGYELSPILWKTIKRGLSAGRVQSVALRLIVEREREIEEFKPASSFQITAIFNSSDKKQFQAELSKKYTQLGDVREFLEHCKQSKFAVKSIQKKRTKRSPSPPFITSTLQQEAARKLGFSVKKTMVIAQKLYETGRITYMRTDSVQMSNVALKDSKQEIIKRFGEKYSKTRQYRTKTAGAQEAHEAIRPTNFNIEKAGSNRNEERLYTLIWKRAIASQMSEAVFDKTTATISISNTRNTFLARGEVMVFDGFLKVYRESQDNGDDEANEHELPRLNEGENLDYLTITALERFSRPPLRYSEASLVRKLEELGIGRPSTYAPTISTIIDRDYVTIENRPGITRKLTRLILEHNSIAEDYKKETAGSEKAKLIPSLMGMIVNDFLVEHFSDIVDYQFTANIEREFDDIAAGKMDWKQMIDEFYSSFHPAVVEKKATVSREEMLPFRELGTDPKTGKKISVRMGPYGLYVQLGDRNDKDKPRFASLQSDQDMKTLTLEEALKLFQLPRKIGQDADGKDVVVHNGPYGPYVKVQGLIASISPLNPFEITLEQALEKMEEKKQIEQKKVIKQFPKQSIKVLNGRWGPYVTNGRKNAKIPKTVNPEDISLDECMELLDKPKRSRRSKRNK